MKNLMIFCALFFGLLPTSNARLDQVAPASSWGNLSRTVQAEILNELEYIADEDLPLETSVIRYTELGFDFDRSLIAAPEHKLYFEKIMVTFDREVSREGIEQSPFVAHGKEEVTSLFLLVNLDGRILGSLMHKSQDGRDENGEDGDISWSAAVRFDPAGGLFRDDGGNPFDDLYFEWSGH